MGGGGEKKRKEDVRTFGTTATTMARWSGAIKVKYRTSPCLKLATVAAITLSVRFEREHRRAYARRMRARCCGTRNNPPRRISLVPRSPVCVQVRIYKIGVSLRPLRDARDKVPLTELSRNELRARTRERESSRNENERKTKIKRAIAPESDLSSIFIY